MTSDGTLPTVVLLHGWGSTAERTWGDSRLLRSLRDAGRRVELVDLPGHGREGGLHDPAEYADIVELTLARLPEGPLDGVGFSLGAKLLLWIDAAQPGTLRRVVATGVGENLFRNEAGAALSAAVSAGDRDAFERGTDAFDIVSEAIDSGNDPAAIGAVIQRPGTPPAPETLRAATAETLLIVGDADVIAGDPRLIAATHPNARISMLADASHVATAGDHRMHDQAAEFLLR